MGIEGHATVFLFPGKRARIHRTGGWVGLGAGPSRCRQTSTTEVQTANPPVRSDRLYRPQIYFIL